MEADGETKNAHTGTIQRERQEETKEITAAVSNEDNDDNVSSLSLM